MVHEYYGGDRFGFAVTECASFYKCSDHRNQVVVGNTIDIVAHHGGHVGFQSQRSPTGARLFDHRVRNLVRYIKESPDLALGKVEQCLIDAFERMDKELKRMVEEDNCWPFDVQAEEMWKTRYNSLVVIVDRGHKRVHVAGSGQVHVLLAKPGEQIKTLTTDSHNAVAEYGRQLHYCPDNVSAGVQGIATRWVNEDEDMDEIFDVDAEETRERVLVKIDRHEYLYFYKQVELEDEHEHLILSSESYIDKRLYFYSGEVYGYVRVPIVDLPYYFDTDLGFEQTICRVTGDCGNSDRAPVLLVLCLDKHEHSKVDNSCSGAIHSNRGKRVKPCEDWDGTGAVVYRPFTFV